MAEGLIAHALHNIAAPIGDGVDGAEVVAVEIAGLVGLRDAALFGLDVDGGELSVGINEVFAPDGVAGG